ncbi:YigZ family protein [Robiginitalea sp. M366]|uniref:IMPACT family protein n=1 Tax=Robiginitalea aestuariiviva TaxID=3036903 RepID=UPI00240E2FD5|nr:YigZ family protein [Robiginitalea aestuariiviva]MDG1573148.1 YigZ family protein [Robiginitalea aestuariiviva]
MEKSPQPYRTLSAPAGPVNYKERKSRFMGYAYPCATAEEANTHVQALRSQYPDATHVCYAYRLGPGTGQVRMQDDGEPSYSAGAPILGQIEAYDLHCVLLCVVRYYGGVKLGVGGLIQAYRETARETLEAAETREVVPRVRAFLEFGYEVLDAVMRCISQHQLELLEQEMALRCAVVVGIPAEKAEVVRQTLEAIAGVEYQIRTGF